MFSDPYLDTIISLVLIYAVLSVVVSLAVEWLNDRLKERGRFLRGTIGRMVNDPFNHPFGRLLYQHPMIARLQRSADRLPAYISAHGFATAYMDVVAGFAPNTAVGLSAKFKAAVGLWKQGPLKTMMLGLIDRCTDAATGEIDLEKARTELVQWYTDHMDRATGTYKDKQRWKLYLFGFVTALIVNVDSIHLARTIFMDKPLRESLVAKADRVAKEYADLPDTVKADTAALRTVALGKEVDHLDSVRVILQQWGLPIGWSADQAPCVWFQDRSTTRADSLFTAKEPLLAYYAQRNNARGLSLQLGLWLVGVVLTGLALSLGAPFWFETLVKLINIRRAGVKPPTSSTP